jgi:hypothetical protein
MDPANIPLPGLGARLRAARKARGLTQEALAAPEFTKSNSCPEGKTAGSNRVPPLVL